MAKVNDCGSEQSNSNADQIADTINFIFFFIISETSNHIFLANRYRLTRLVLKVIPNKFLK